MTCGGTGVEAKQLDSSSHLVLVVPIAAGSIWQEQGGLVYYIFHLKESRIQNQYHWNHYRHSKIQKEVTNYCQQ